MPRPDLFPRHVENLLGQSHRRDRRSLTACMLTCGGDIQLIAFITNPAPIRKILVHLGERLALPRSLPAIWPALVRVHDDRHTIHAWPADLPVIDTRKIWPFHPAVRIEAGLQTV